MKILCSCCLLPVLFDRNADTGRLSAWCPRTDQRSPVQLKCQHSYKWGDRVVQACVNCGEKRGQATNA